MPQLPLITVPGFKPDSGQSTSLTANNFNRHNEELLSLEVKELKAALAAKDEKNKALAAEIDEMRRELATATAAKGTDETEAPELNVQEQASEKTQDSVQDYSAKSKTKKNSRRSKSKSTPNPHLAETAVYGPGYTALYASTSSESFSTNATMSDLPGPGRGLGKLYSRAGKILELCTNRLAHRCGYGPHAVYERFCTSIFTRFPFHFWEGQRQYNSDRAKTAIVWDRLLKYAQSGTVHTQKTAVRKMRQLAFDPRAYEHIRGAIIEDIDRRGATLRILYGLYSSEAVGAECSDDIIEIGRLSETICRNVVLELGNCDRLWSIDRDMTWAMFAIDNEYHEKKSVIDGSRATEDVLNALWGKYRKRFRRLVRRLRVYFGSVGIGEDHRDLWSNWLQLYCDLNGMFSSVPYLQPRLMELYDEVENKRSRAYCRGYSCSVEQDFNTDVNPTPLTNSY